MLDEILKKRDLLPILKMNDGRDVTLGLWPERRAEMLDALCRHSYGYTPECTGPGKGEVVSEDIYAYAGKVLQQQIMNNQKAFLHPVLVILHFEDLVLFLLLFAQEELYIHLLKLLFHKILDLFRKLHLYRSF